MFKLKIQTNLFRFFSTKFPHVKFQVFKNIQASDIKIQKLNNRMEQMRNEMLKLYPDMLVRNFKDQVVYTLQSRTPEQILEEGGLTNSNSLWLSNTGSGDNKGSICFSLLPEVTTIFSNLHLNSTKLYLYAFSLTGDFLLPGGRWRQIIAPSAFPIPHWWAARKLLNIDPESRKINLGPLWVSDDKNLDLIKGERFKEYCDNNLIKPEEFDVGEDFPLEFKIEDTLGSKQFQEEVQAHYGISNFSFRK
jgi:hypothetical protein